MHPNALCDLKKGMFTWKAVEMALFYFPTREVTVNSQRAPQKIGIIYEDALDH